MPYTKTLWIDDSTPLNATNLNKHENAIAYAVERSEFASSLANLQYLHLNEIENTTQFPTYNDDGDVIKIEHKLDSHVVRTDVFSYSDTLITETRTMDDGKNITLSHFFDETGRYIKTEVK